MLMSFPSFISEKEQTPSELLYSNIKIMIQTQIQEIWVDLSFGTELRDLIKQGINNITLSEIREEIEMKLVTYFSEDIVINLLEVYQDLDKVIVNLEYTEVKTGKLKTIQNIETIITD